MPLPHHYLITPNPDNEEEFLAALERSLQAGTRLLQLKAKKLDSVAYRALALKVIPMAHRYDCQVLLTSDAAQVEELGADGLHLDSKALQDCNARPLPDYYLLAISGHTLEALQKGAALGASLAVLSPIKYTSAHPDIEPLGWDGMKQICVQLSMPIFALGGVNADDEDDAISAGGRGVAGSRGYWKA